MKHTFTNLHNTFLLCFCSLASLCFAQSPGSVDLTFTTMPGPSYGMVSSVVEQPDSKILMGGGFGFFDNESYSYLARANGDGTLDESFDTLLALDGNVNKIILLSDGKILIAGGFTTYNGVSRNYIARLNADGTLDTTFNIGTGAGHVITCMVIQQDGKIIIGGLFTSYNGVNRSRIARLNADGSLDTTFDPGAGADNGIYDLAIQPNGKILVGGLFNTFNNVDKKSLVRLNSNGSIDNTFDIGTGGLGTLSIVLQQDEKILIGGFFTNFNGVARNRIARLNTDGSVDTTFDPGLGASHLIQAIGLSSDGKILAGGQFVNFNGGNQKYLVSLNPDGTLDTTFDFGTGPDGWVYEILPQSNGKIYICGDFDSFDGESRNSVVRLQGSCNTPAPQGESIQTITVNNISEATLEDLVINGTDIKWYDLSGNLLAADTQLVNDTTYYATQTVNGCESSYFSVSVQIQLGLNTNEKVPFYYYPNPVKDKLFIVSENTINLVEVYTLQGQKVFVKSWHTPEESLDMSQFSNSAYLIKVHSTDKISSFMVIKSN